MPRRTSHTGSPLLVPPRASTPTTTSLGLDILALTRMSRCVRPTSANHCLPEPAPALPVSGLLDVDPEGTTCDRRVRRFHDALDPLRWVMRQRGRLFAVTRSARGRWPSRGSNARSVHDFTSDASSPSTVHASAFAGQLAWCADDRDRLRRPLVKKAAFDDPKRLPSNRRPLSLAAAPRESLATGPGCPLLTSRTIRLSAFERQRNIRFRSLQPESDARARRQSSRPSPAPGRRPVRVSTGMNPPGEPRRSTTPLVAGLAPRYLP